MANRGAKVEPQAPQIEETSKGRFRVLESSVYEIQCTSQHRICRTKRQTFCLTFCPQMPACAAGQGSCHYNPVMKAPAVTLEPRCRAAEMRCSYQYKQNTEA